MSALGNGLLAAGHDEDALSVQEAELSLRRRVGDSERSILEVQGNLAVTYRRVGRAEQALRLRRDVYSGHLKLSGEENVTTLLAANNYAHGLLTLQRYAEAKSLLRKTIPLARRVLGESDALSFRMSLNYTEALYSNPSATLDDVREAVTTLEKTARTARRVLGGAHPLTLATEEGLRVSRATLHADEGTSPGNA